MRASVLVRPTGRQSGPEGRPTGSAGPRVVIVTAAMGGGHLQVSHELGRRFIAWGCDVDIIDLLDLMPPVAGGLLGRGYPFMVNHAPMTYERLYDQLIRDRSLAVPRMPILTSLLAARLRRILQPAPPALVISTYPVASLVLGSLQSRGELACPAATVITTFSVNDLWLHPGVDVELCISAQAAEDVRRRSGRAGLVCGPILRPGFGRAATPRRFDPGRECHVALVTTGSVGLVGSAVEAASVIAARPGWRAVVLCGHNDRLRRRMAGQRGVEAVAWIDDMPEMMAGADVLVDNAAGMCSKEALGVGLPIVSFRPIPGNGRHDTDALACLGLTDVTDSATTLMAGLDRLTGDDRYRASRIARGQALFVDEPLAPLRELAATSAGTNL